VDEIASSTERAGLERHASV